ncbi:MAG: Crp/Fnr family transcriptional regulator [Vampirovibrionales bacterium]
MNTWYVQHTQLTERLSDAEQSLFKTEGLVKILEKGQFFLPSESEYPEGIHIILKGYAKLLTMNMEGKRFAISIMQPGDFLGQLIKEPSAPSQEPIQNEDFLEMMTTTHLLCVKKDTFQRVVTENPQLCIHVLQMLQGKTQVFHRKLSDLLFKDVHARIAQLFLDLTFTHGKECPYAFGLKRDLRLKHHEIAELVGASRPVTSMTLNQFLKQDLIHKHDGLICLNNIQGLQHVAQRGAVAMPIEMYASKASMKHVYPA